MPTAGPHARGQKPGFVYRGSKRRVAKLSPFDDLPFQFWLVVAIAVFMLAISVLLLRDW
jgi:hypothetical protein